MKSLVATVVLVALIAAGSGCTNGVRARQARSAEVEAGAAAAPPSGENVSAGEDEPTAAAGPEELPIPDLGYNAREGRMLFRYYCAICHGEQGHGDGFNAYNLDPKPRDLADPALQEQRSDADLLAVIRSGGAVAGLTTGMPPWGRTLNERQLRNIVDYLRTLRSEP